MSLSLFSLLSAIEYGEIAFAERFPRVIRVGLAVGAFRNDTGRDEIVREYTLNNNYLRVVIDVQSVVHSAEADAATFAQETGLFKVYDRNYLQEIISERQLGVDPRDENAWIMATRFTPCKYILVASLVDVGTRIEPILFDKNKFLLIVDPKFTVKLIKVDTGEQVKSVTLVSGLKQVIEAPPSAWSGYKVYTVAQVSDALKKILSAAFNEFMEIEDFVIWNGLIESAEDGEYIIPVGKSDGARVGDLFRVYKTKCFKLRSGRKICKKGKYVGLIRITDFFPDEPYAVAEKVESTEEIKEGYFVQFVVPPPEPPRVVALDKYEGRKVKITWTAPANMKGVLKYNLYVSTTPQPPEKPTYELRREYDHYEFKIPSEWAGKTLYLWLSSANLYSESEKIKIVAHPGEKKVVKADELLD
jgi:hypothetical protein